MGAFTGETVTCGCCPLRCRPKRDEINALKQEPRIDDLRFSAQPQELKPISPNQYGRSQIPGQLEEMKPISDDTPTPPNTTPPDVDPPRPYTRLGKRFSLDQHTQEPEKLKSPRT